MILTFFNHAGGVGKTSSVRDLGVALTAKGKRVLLIDLDPQASLTKWLDLYAKAKPTIALDGTKTDPTATASIRDLLPLPTPLRAFDMDVIPSFTDELFPLELELTIKSPNSSRLRQVLRGFKNMGDFGTVRGIAQDYDFVLIDAPPSLGLLTRNAVSAADAIVVPLPTNTKGTDGLANLRKLVNDSSFDAPDLHVKFFLLTMFQGNAGHDKDMVDQYPQILADYFPGAHLSTPVRYRGALYKDAQSYRVPPALGARAKKDRVSVSEEWANVTDELLRALA